MERTGFEPFGEQLVSATDTQPKSRASKLLLRPATGLFWSLVAAIVLARAAFFEPASMTASATSPRWPRI